MQDPDPRKSLRCIGSRILGKISIAMFGPEVPPAIEDDQDTDLGSDGKV